MVPTADPSVSIEALGPGWVRYRNDVGRRWEVHGVCDRRGDCLIGSVIDGVTIVSHEHLVRVATERAPHRVDSDLDVPVTPEFQGCCPFVYVELSRA